MYKKIGTKLIITYFLILITAFFVTAVTFNSLSKLYLVNETRKQLRSEGNTIISLLSSTPLETADIKEKIIEKKLLRAAEQFIDSEIVVTNAAKKIVYQSEENADRNLINVLNKLKDIRSKGYVVERMNIVGKAGQAKGTLILYTKLKNIYSLNKLMKRTQFISFIVAGIAALLIGLIFKHSLTKPIKLLMQKMNYFSANKTLSLPDIKTGDEIEQLDKCFRTMINRIKQNDEAQRRFLQNTSHELKTPLMSIQGYAEAIKDGVVEGREMEESLNIIIEQCQRLKKIVEEIVYLTKLENTEETYNMKSASLCDVIQKAAKGIKPLADENGINIKMQLGFDHNGIYDEEKLVRAFINILSNAVRYAKSEINIKNIDKFDKIQITIADDGKGFENGEESKVFERFYKGENGNTGLGLAITKAIIEGHSGYISASNNNPSGAIFTIELPKDINKSK